MPSNEAVAVFDTQDLRPWNKPQPENSYKVKCPSNAPNYAAGITEFDMAYGHNIRVKTYVNNYTEKDMAVHMDAWADSVFYSGKSSLFQVYQADRDFQTGAAEVAGPGGREVKFARPYAQVPQVVVWLTGFDFEQKKNFRLKATPTSIGKTGFTLQFETWHNTHLYWASAHWVAFPSNHPTVTSGSYNITDTRPWNQPTEKTEGKVAYPSGKFVGKPQLVFGVNQLDVEANKGTSIRFKATTSNESADGFTWHLDTWFDTTLYMLGASYIALQI